MHIKMLLGHITVFLYCISIASCVVENAADAFSLNVHDDGSYNLTLGGKTWLQSGPTFFNSDGQRWSSDDTLTLIDVKHVTHSTFSEYWTETRFTYGYGTNTTASVQTAIRQYPTKKKILFTQKYLAEVTNTSIGGISSFNKTIAGFPSFQVADPDEQLGFLSFGGYMFGDTDKTTGRFSSQTDNINDGMIGGPLALFNQGGQTVVLSTYDNYMAASMWHDGKPGGHIAWGIMGGVDSIPENFTYTTLLSFDDGINNAFWKWGNSMYNRLGTWGVLNNIFNRVGNRTHDVSLNYLGYWTDNGAYYYYQPEVNKTFEDTILGVQAYANLTGIPYKYVQIDSWWYPKDTQYNAVTTWTPMPSVFPDGLRSLSERTGWKYVAHNRYWSKDTPYASSYNWVIGQYGSLPNDIEFWRDLFNNSTEWGLAVYEQDWLNIQTRYMTELQTSLTLGRDWLTQMGQAAAEYNVTIQYCMANPRHAMQAIELPVVTQARVSDDYQYLRPDQWKIGVTSIFADAMKLYPYKDTFWTTSVQPGNPYNKTEPYPALEAAVSSLSKGPVGPSDMIGGTNMDLLMKCCRGDGMLLKPSRVAKAIDRQIIYDAFNADQGKKAGEIWQSRVYATTNGRSREYGLLFAADVKENITVGIPDMTFNVLKEGIYYPYNNISQWKHFDIKTTINLQNCSKENFCLYYFSPYLNSSSVTAILGEVSKWVPISQQRIHGIHLDGDNVSLTLNGSSLEIIEIWYLVNGQLKKARCDIHVFEQSTECVLYWHPATTSTTPASKSARTITHSSNPPSGSTVDPSINKGRTNVFSYILVSLCMLATAVHIS